MENSALLKKIPKIIFLEVDTFLKNVIERNLQSY